MRMPPVEVVSLLLREKFKDMKVELVPQDLTAQII